MGRKTNADSAENGETATAKTDFFGFWIPVINCTDSADERDTESRVRARGQFRVALIRSIRAVDPPNRRQKESVVALAVTQFSPVPYWFSVPSANKAVVFVV